MIFISQFFRFLKIRTFLFASCLIVFISPANAQFVDEVECSKYKYYVTVCAMFQNEARFLKEWIEFHKLIGVEHFYLYNNNSTDEYLEVLAPYISLGEVELFEWPSDPTKDWTPRQIEAIAHAVAKAKNESSWLAIIDIDEYIVPTRHENLVQFLKEHRHYGSISAGWRAFGTSWVDRIPEDKLMIETLLFRAAYVEGQAWLHKTIVRPQAVQYPNVHSCGLYSNVQAISYANQEEYPPLLIHHYWTRDIDFLIHVKRERRERYLQRQWTQQEQENYIDLYNDVEDPIMMRYVPRLREMVFGTIKSSPLDYQIETSGCPFSSIRQCRSNLLN